MLMSREQNAGQSRNIKIGSKSFKTVEKSKHLGTILTNFSSTHEEMKSRLSSGNAFYSLYSGLLSRIVNFEIRRTVILRVILRGFETWPVAFSDAHTPRVL